MIDTLVLTGHVKQFLHEVHGTTEIRTYNSKHNTKIKEFSKTESYRLLHDVQLGRMRVELSVSKWLTKNNWYNYIPHEPYYYNRLLEATANHFFNKDSDVYISRIDISKNYQCGTHEDALELIEAYRITKPHAQRITKFGHQRYKTSVVYYNRAYSMIIYYKDAEEKKKTIDYPDFTVRFEMAIRIQCLRDLEIEVEPYLGCHIKILQQNIQKVLNFRDGKFSDWIPKVLILPSGTPQQRMAGLVMKQTGLTFLELYNRNLISKSAYYRLMKQNTHEARLPTHWEIEHKDIPLNYRNLVDYFINTKTLKNGL